jgi:hypothetical protein
VPEVPHTTGPGVCGFRQTQYTGPPDQAIRLAVRKSRRAYSRRLRRIEFDDKHTRHRLFFTWLKQHLTVKHFGNSENAVKAQK